MIELTNKSQINHLRQQTEKVIEGSFHINTSWTTQQGWITLPVESASHFNESDAKLLSAALVTLGTTDFFAIATEFIENFPIYWQLQPTIDDLLAFSKKCAHFNFALIPFNLTCIILCTTQDYFLVAGPLEFVHRASGCEPAVAWEDFVDFANGDERLLAIAQRYNNAV